MNNRLLTIAMKVIEKADGEHPADGVLRTELKNAKGISRNDGSLVSEAVFAYYRWLGWLDEKVSLAERIPKAVELHRSFQNDPDSIPETELQRAIPEWVNGELKVSTEWLRVLQLEPNIWLRARLGTGRKLAETLGECWVAGDGPLGDALRYEGAEDLFRTAEFHAGEFELQDLSSQMVGWLCNPQPGETWWDACAGEGGKALHLCDLMRGKGLLWASDRAEWRLQKLKRRAARAKVFNYRTVWWDGGAKLPTKTKFDKILVDAPCSGIGTWQRNPQARWTTTPQDVRELSAMQKDLVANATAALKPGGRLVYSVCTLTNAETMEVAEEISKRFPELEPIAFANPLKLKDSPARHLTLWPQDIHANGMFICGWRKPTV